MENDELFHEIPLLLFERNLLDVVSVFEECIADFFGCNIQITVAEMLILFADIGFDIFQLFNDALGFEALTCRFIALTSQRLDRQNIYYFPHFLLPTNTRLSEARSKL